MNEIAAKVGLSKPTLYHYFRSKEAILVRLYEEVMAESLSSARSIVDSAPSPLEAVRQLLSYRARYTCENQALHKVFFEEEDELPSQLLYTVIEGRKKFEDILKTAVLQHVDTTDVELPTSCTVYVNTCLGAVNWAYKWFDPHGHEDATTLGEHIAALMLQPLLAPAPVSNR